MRVGLDSKESEMEEAVQHVLDEYHLEKDPSNQQSD